VIAGRPYSARQCRDTATHILERLVGQQPNIPDYQFLLALCLRPPAAVIKTRSGAEHLRRAVGILERLKEAHPEVLEYRYELAISYAWVNVGLFPWQQPVAESAAESNLRKALSELRWLVERNPSIPHYACSRALSTAKLAELHARQGRRSDAVSLFRQALLEQEAVIERFPELPASHQVVCEFMRMRLALAVLEQNGDARDRTAQRQAREMLKTCVARLTQLAKRPELADDRLVKAALPIATEALGGLACETIH
jgi:hypothetical protein